MIPILVVFGCSIILLALVVLVMMVRNQVVFKCRGRAIDEVSLRAKKAINDGDDWMAPYRVLDSYPSYNAMVLSLMKWTYKQFYPGITERLAE